MTPKRHKRPLTQKADQLTEVPKMGRYPSIEAASLAKMESAKEFIANLDMTLFKKTAMSNK